MNTALDQWAWIIESVVLLFLLGLIVKIFVADSRKVDTYNQKMWDSTKRCQEFLQQIDQEFDIMNKCAKSIKNVFLNFRKVYKEISKGTKTVEEAIREARVNLPEELRAKFSHAFPLAEDGSSTDENSSTDLNVVKTRYSGLLSDEEQYRLFLFKRSDREGESRNHDFLS